MDDAVLIPYNTNGPNMGATSNSNGICLVALQEKKKSIEEALCIKEKELKELCLQEAELTGVVPSEMPLQPGESPPSIRRKVGTLYLLSESLLKPSNKDENISDLELQLQLHANMAEAALGLAHKQNLSKTLRKQHKMEYQHHKRQYKTLQEKIALLKETQLSQSALEEQVVSDKQKHKKKPRAIDIDDISMKSNDPFQKHENRQSLRSLQHTMQINSTAAIYPQFEPRRSESSSTIPSNMVENRCDDLSSSFYKLNFSGYKYYLERRDNYGPARPTFNQGQSRYQHHPESPQQSSHQYNYFSYNTFPHSSPIFQHIPLPQTTPPPQQTSSPSSDLLGLSFNSKNNHMYYQTAITSHHMNTYARKNAHNTAIPVSRQSSPHLNSNFNKFQYSTPVSSQNSLILGNESCDSSYNAIVNPHQLQPHQQYEQNAGLGGCWKRKENGEIIWCNSVSKNETNWQREKRFGSLDRRKNRKMKRISPDADGRSATLTKIPYAPDQKTSSVIHSPQVQTRNSQDRQLVRTQSLGSVGVQTSDNAWRSDDNSSCDSENQERSRNSLRRQKQKEWRETFLDSPELPPLSNMERCQSTVPLMLAPEEKYTSVSSPITSKLPFEIPAESNPHPRIPEANMEIFNNNIPKNCTVVQAGHCKPYHEETKPFEMSDFYKYSTKFKKSPAKKNSEEISTSGGSNTLQRNLNEYFDNERVFHHIVHPIAGSSQELNSRQLDNIETGLLTDLQDLYPPDMWYTSQTPGESENNNATLV